MEKHTLLFWSPPSSETFDILANKGYQIISALKKFGTELHPNYLSANKKSEATKFDFSREMLEESLRKSVNKEGKEEFPHLGYGMQFFSSLNESESSSISIRIGNTNPRFKNTVVIGLSQEFDVMNTSDRLTTLFTELIEVLHPFWGAIVNDKNSNRYEGFWKNNMPTTVHWLNFFGSDLVNRIGAKKIQKADWHRVQQISEGYYLQLSAEPILDADIGAVSKQNKTNRLMGL